VVLAGALLAAGCGNRTAPIEGTVVFADAPDTPATELAGYVITFESEGEGRTPVSGTGAVGPDGTFRVSTFQEGDGALRGRQKVAITPPFRPDGSMMPSKILPKYHDLKTSGLTIDVQPGVNRVKLTVERNPKVK
jgi:hypothetical protein